MGSNGSNMGHDGSTCRNDSLVPHRRIALVVRDKHVVEDFAPVWFG